MVTAISSNTAGSNVSSTATAPQPAAQEVSVPQESLENFIARVLQDFANISKERLFSIANLIDQNNKDLKQLGQANTDLSAMMNLFPKDGDDKTIILPRDTINKLREPMDDIALKNAVDKVFANPNAPLEPLKSKHDNQEMNSAATNAMNKYVAFVQSGLRSGVLKASDKDRFVSLNVTKAELQTFNVAIKTQTDSLSNISTQYQTDAQKYNNQLQTLSQTLSNIESLFSGTKKSIAGNMR